jgi:hypothetical protein
MSDREEIEMENLSLDEPMELEEPVQPKRIKIKVKKENNRQNVIDPFEADSSDDRQNVIKPSVQENDKPNTIHPQIAKKSVGKNRVQPSTPQMVAHQQPVAPQQMVSQQQPSSAQPMIAQPSLVATHQQIAFQQRLMPAPPRPVAYQQLPNQLFQTQPASFPYCHNPFCLYPDKKLSEGTEFCGHCSNNQKRKAIAAENKLKKDREKEIDRQRVVVVRNNLTSQHFSNYVDELENLEALQSQIDQKMEKDQQRYQNIKNKKSKK